MSRRARALAALLLSALLALLGAAQTASACSAASGHSRPAAGSTLLAEEEEKHKGELPSTKTGMGLRGAGSRTSERPASSVATDPARTAAAPRVVRPGVGRVPGGLPGAPPLTLLQVFRC